MIVTTVRFEHRDDPVGLGTPVPRISWQLAGADPAEQTGYEIALGDEVVRVDSAEQVLVPWPFRPLGSRERAAVRVRVRAAEEWTAWSDPAELEIGLLRPQDWSARLISPRGHGAAGEPAPVLHRAVELRPGIAAARLYVTAHGIYELSVNGARVGTELLAPGWTDYRHRLRYQVHDVTTLLRPGRNEVEALLGNGWYRGRLGWDGGRARYGDRLALLAQLEVRYADGGTEVVGTDERWTVRAGRVRADDLYDGQHTDLVAAEGDASGPVDVLGAPSAALVAAEGPPVRATGVLPAVRTWRSSSGRTLVDFGQNLVGWVRLTATGPGSVVVRHAEVLADGELAVRPLRSARATDRYDLPAGRHVLEPSLTFHGFRYAEIIAPGPVTGVEAVVVGSDLRRTGWFDCSDPDLARFHENVVWSTRGNFLDVPTDCPQRDERLGWTGDIQVFAPTASFLFDTAGFLGSWLADLAAGQHPDGTVPFVVPDLLPPGPPAAAWGDAAVVVPWVLYERRGDAGVLARQFDSMRAWVQRAAAATTDGVWAGGFQFGDWLDPAAPPDDPFAARADPDVVATACLIRCARILADAAAVLGLDPQPHARLAAATTAAFNRHYVTASGRILSDSPTAYAVALAWDLLSDPGQRAAAGHRLADLVRVRDFRIATGFVGTPVIADALCAAGHPDLAHRLVLSRHCPSWLYPVTMGATTVWERWDSMLPDGTVNPGQMTSFNHYALGAVADWLHRRVAGLAPAAPGYRRIEVHPLPPAALTRAAASHETPYGLAAVAWTREAGRFRLQVTVPPGTTAIVHLPDGGRHEAGPGRHAFTAVEQAVRSGPVRTVRELIDAPRAWRRVCALLVGRGLAVDAAEVAQRAGPCLDLPVAELVTQFTWDRLTADPGLTEAIRRCAIEQEG